MNQTRPRDLAGRVPPPVLVAGGIISVQLGAAIAKHLFSVVPPTSMVWLRLASSAIVFTVFFRPAVRGKTSRDWLIALGFGCMLMGMNWSIYQSFARIPLGMAVTLEFLGPLALAIVGSRRARDLIWVALAGVGVALLGFTPHGLTWPGVVFALVAGAFWAGYIVFSARTGRHWSGVTGLTVASLVGAILLAPPAMVEAGSRLLQPEVLGLGVAIGLLSSVIPYSLELTALRRMPPNVFSILMSLEPAAAALAAMVVLHEFLAPLQWVAIGCVVVASVGATRSHGSGRLPDLAGAEA